MNEFQKEDLYGAVTVMGLGDIPSQRNTHGTCRSAVTLLWRNHWLQQGLGWNVEATAKTVVWAIIETLGNI